ncbi:NAC domain-containing protein 74-like [Eucalyptus grandis]|uniref:NAC domain-containing protein 74-like n=1 Tax=Eucalyptus grandis TaxID=71139 RepID=UPI00192F0E1E|nr:NAC domain-containing protein 74-like [Eucalyptus grandis]
MGTKRILVYYEGRQPKGRRTDVAMHEYHLNSDDSDSKISDPTAMVLCRIINRKSKEAKSATASASTDLSSHLSSAQAIPGVTTESDYPTETLNTGLHNRNVPIPDQQPQMGKEQPSCCGDNWHVDGPSDGRCHIPNSPSDGISITDFLNSDANSEQTQTCKEKHLLYDDNQHVDGPSDPSYGNGLEDLFN